MKIIEDTGNKTGKHKLKHSYFDSQGIEVLSYGLPVGDYIIVTDAVADVIERKKKRGIQPKKMDFLGTYKVCVDTKFSIEELVGDICGKQHERFRDECILAQQNGIKLYILVDSEDEWIGKKKDIYNPAIRSLGGLFSWKNKRAFIWKGGKQAYPTATKGATLAKACITMRKKYGVEFLFCDPKDSGRRIIELLGGVDIGNQD